MGDLLRDMMNERADTEAAPELDLDAIVRAGDRRVWRRRAVAGIGTAAAVATLTLAVPAVMDGVGNDSTPPVATQPTESERSGGFATRTTTYAVDSSIYYGEEAIDVSPYRVGAFVQTDDGFVVAATDGTLVLADGFTVEVIGQVAHRPGYAAVAGDDRGSLVTWVDDSQAAAEFVVYDTSARQVVAREPDPGAPIGDKPAEFGLPVVEALDEAIAYWHRSDGTVAYDIYSGDVRMLAEGASPQWLKDVEDGTLAFSSFDDLAVVVSSDPSADEPLLPAYTDDAPLSLDAGYLAIDQEGTVVVLDVTSGSDVTPTGSSREGRFVQWTGKDEYIAFGFLSSGAGRFEQCGVNTQACTPATGDVDGANEIVFPDGRSSS